MKIRSALINRLKTTIGGQLHSWVMFKWKMYLHKALLHEFKFPKYRLRGKYIQMDGDDYYEVVKCGEVKLVSECPKCGIEIVTDVNEHGVVTNFNGKYCLKT